LITNVIKRKIAGKKEIKLMRLISMRKEMKNPRNKNDKSEIVSIRLTSERKKSLLKYAIGDDRTFSSLINKIIGIWLRKQNKQDSWR
jgi:hypothetical protein